MKIQKINNTVSKIITTGDGSKFWADDGKYKTISNTGDAVSLKGILIDDSTRTSGKMLGYNGVTGKDEYMNITVGGIVSTNGNIIIPSGSPKTITSGQEATFFHSPVTDDKIMINIKEQVTGSNFTDNHVDFSNSNKYILQDSDKLTFSSNTIKLNIDTNIPYMTSNTSPKGIASASSETSTQHPYNAFDGIDNNTHTWATNSISTGWLSYKFDSPICICNYKISPTILNMCPKNWTFEGSNDGTNWVVLDTRNNVTAWTIGLYNTYSFNNTSKYLYYKINISLNGGSPYIQINEFKMLTNLLEPTYIKTSGLSNFSLTTVDNITSLSMPITTTTNTSIKCLFSVDNGANWLYKNETGLHIYIGDLKLLWTSSNTNIELQTYFTNLSMAQLTADLSSLNITPVSLDFSWQFTTSVLTETPILSGITLNYITKPHTEFASFGGYDEQYIKFGVKRINDSTLGIKNLTSTDRIVSVNIIIGS